MAKKGNKITLEVKLPNGKIRQDSFDVEHAERLLKMPNNGGWELPIDSEYQFDKEHGINRSTPKSTKRADQEGQDK